MSHYDIHSYKKQAAEGSEDQNIDFGSLPNFHHCFHCKLMSAKMLTVELSIATKAASYA